MLLSSFPNLLSAHNCQLNFVEVGLSFPSHIKQAYKEAQKHYQLSNFIEKHYQLKYSFHPQPKAITKPVGKQHLKQLHLNHIRTSSTRQEQYPRGAPSRSYIINMKETIMEIKATIPQPSRMTAVRKLPILKFSI
uniref:Uncharacterized protein n=1 Tax=Cacopsylla melanoneura TaxID=428564 RepID=A0A8D9BXE2_9HEMI